MLSATLPVANRPGLFVVVPPLVAESLVKGYMKLYAKGDEILVETITRNRFSLRQFDSSYRVVFFAVTAEGGLLTSP